MTLEYHTNPEALASELEAIDTEVALYENLTEIADGVKGFAETVSRYTAEDVEKAFTEDKSLQFELGQLKDALGEFSETFEGYYSKVTDPAKKIGNVAKVTDVVKHLAQTVHDADELSGPDQLRAMQGLLEAVKDVMGLSEALKVNPVIGAMLTGYAAAIKSAANKLMEVAAQREELYEAIEVAGGARPQAEIDAERRAAEAEAEAERLAELQEAADKRLGDLYMRQYEIVSKINEKQLRIIKARCAREHRELIREVLDITSPYGGWNDKSTINEETIDSLLGTWVDGMEEWLAGVETPDSVDYVEFPKDKSDWTPAHHELASEIQERTDAYRDAREKLRPVIDCIREMSEQYLIGLGEVPPTSKRRLVWMGAGGLLAMGALIAGAVWVGGALGVDGEAAGDSPSDVGVSGQAEDAVSSGEVETEEGSVVAEGSCPAPAEPMTLSSDQIGPTLPSLYDNPYDSNFAAPGFEWSGVPEEATELAIVIMRLDVEPIDRSVDPWAESVPEGEEDWIVTGIDPETTSLAPSSWDTPLPEGVSEWPAGAVEVQLPDGTRSRSKFIGPVYSSGYNLEGPYLFTVFALCDPNPDQPDAHMIGWIRRFSVARGWFYADVG